jgi:hypothetical protein
MSEPIKTGDELTLEVATLGKNCKLAVNGVNMPGIRGFKLESDVGGISTLEVRAIYPWPPLKGG